MKKIMLLVMVVLAISITSCKKAKLKKDIEGTWLATEYTYSEQFTGFTFSTSDVDSYSNQITFNKDKTYSSIVNVLIDNCHPTATAKTSSGSWDFVDNNTITIKDYDSHACVLQNLEAKTDFDMDIEVEDDVLTATYTILYNHESGDASSLRETVKFLRK